MSIENYADSFAGKRVVHYNEDTGATEPPGSCVYRIGSSEHDSGGDFDALLERFLSDPNVHPVVGLVVGTWSDEMYDSSSPFVVSRLSDAKMRLPHLRALFFGDILREEHEISWINQSDMTPLLNAYPELQHFRVRGANGLRFTDLSHDNLLSLIVESGGLPEDPLRDIFAAKLPKLEHLELWLGDNSYGAVPPSFLKPLLTYNPFPKLRTLGLRNYEFIDMLCESLIQAPILDEIRVLDLSNGNLSDAGLDELLAASEKLKKLERLDLHHHYLSDEGMRQAQSLGIPVDLSGRQVAEIDDGNEYRGILASE